MEIINTVVEIINTVVEIMTSPVGAGVLLSLLSLSEALAAIPAIKANAIHQVIWGLLKKLAPKRDIA